MNIRILSALIVASMVVPAPARAQYVGGYVGGGIGGGMWGTGMYGAMPSCPYGYGGADGAYDEGDEVSELKEERQAAKDLLKDKKKQLKDLEKERDASREDIDKIIQDKYLERIYEHMENGFNCSCKSSSTTRRTRVETRDTETRATETRDTEVVSRNTVREVERTNTVFVEVPGETKTVIQERVVEVPGQAPAPAPESAVTSPVRSGEVEVRDLPPTRRTQPQPQPQPQPRQPRETDSPDCDPKCTKEREDKGFCVRCGSGKKPPSYGAILETIFGGGRTPASEGMTTEGGRYPAAVDAEADVEGRSGDYDDEYDISEDSANETASTLCPSEEKWQTPHWKAICRNDGYVASKACTHARYRKEGVKTWETNYCVRALERYRKDTIEMNKLRDEIGQIEDDIKRITREIGDAKRDAKRDEMEADCKECLKAERRSYRTEKSSSTLTDVLGGLLQVGVGVGLGKWVNNLDKKNATMYGKLGYPYSRNPYAAIGVGLPFVMNGIYGALGGGTAGGFGCAGGMYGGGFPYGPYGMLGPYGLNAGIGGGIGGGVGIGGNPYMMGGLPTMGGGMYMPGMGPWGMAGPWGNGGIYPYLGGGIGAGGGLGGGIYAGIPGVGGGLYGGLGGGLGGGIGGGIPGLGGGIGGGLYGNLPGLGGGLYGGLYGNPIIGGGLGGISGGLGDYGLGGGLGGLGGGLGGGVGGGAGWQYQQQLAELQMQQYSLYVEQQKRAQDNALSKLRVQQNLMQKYWDLMGQFQSLNTGGIGSGSSYYYGNGNYNYNLNTGSFSTPRTSPGR